MKTTITTSRNLLIAFSLISGAAFAAADEVPVPASKQDVQELKKQGNRIEREIKGAAAEAAESQDAARSADKAEHDGIKTAIESVKTATEKTNEAISNTDRTLDNGLTKIEREIRIAEISGALALLAVGAFFMLRTLRSRNMKQPAPVLMMPQREEAQVMRLSNPEIPDLLRLKEKTGQTRFPISIKPDAKPGFPVRRPVDCDAEFISGQQKPVVFFPGETKPVSWDKRVKHASNFYTNDDVANVG